jgi:hypothetical protein
MLHSSGHQAQKKPIRKFNHLPPILGVKWGAGMENVGKKCTKVTVDLASLGITYIALAISDQWGILSCCLRPRCHQPKLCKIVRRKTRSFIQKAGK